MTDRRTIICALDYSEGSEAALVRAADLAERFHARLHLLHVLALFDTEHGSAPQPDTSDADALDRLRVFAAGALGGDDALAELGPDLAVRRSPQAADGALDYAEAVGADLLVVGTHGRRGVRRLLIGSTAEEIVRRARCPVLTVPNGARRTAPTPSVPVLVPVDFSVSSRRALAVAKAFAEYFEAPVELVHVIADEPYPAFYYESGVIPLNEVSALASSAESHLRRLDAELGGRPAAEFHVRHGVAHREIAACAASAGLVVMATRGLSGLRHLLLGSVTERSLRHTPCPVLSIPAVEREAAVETVAAGGVA